MINLEKVKDKIKDLPLPTDEEESSIGEEVYKAMDEVGSENVDWSVVASAINNKVINRSN